MSLSRPPFACPLDTRPTSHDARAPVSEPDPCHTCPSEIDLATELSLAKQALAEGDLLHASFHISGGLVASPTDAGVHALIDAVLARDPSFALAAPEDGGEYAGRAALRAVLAHRRGDDTTAMALLLRVHGALPEAGFDRLLNEQLADLRRVREVDPDRIVDALGWLVAVPDRARGLTDLIARLRAVHPGCELLGVIEVRLARRIGKPKEALKLAHALAARHPTSRALITLGATLSEQGDRPSARAAYLRATELDPTNGAVHLDLGDWALEDDDHRTAKHHYDRALAIDAQQPWALASRTYLDALASEGDDARTSPGAARAALRQLALDGNDRAMVLHGGLVPFDLSLDPPGTAVVNAAKQLRAQGLTPEGQMAVSSFEPPSAVHAAASMLGGVDPDELVAFGEIPTPDPRLPRWPVDHTLWTFREPGFFGKLRPLRAVGRPALDPPPPEIARAVATLALEPWSASDWYDAARTTSLSRPPVALAQLLAAMVNTPDQPSVGQPGEADAWDIDAWSFRTMVAAAFLIAGTPGPWLRSARRTALLSALHGPTDWTTTAAILAIGEAARQEPEASDDVMSLLEGMIRPVSPVEATCVQEALGTVLGRLSGA